MKAALLFLVIFLTLQVSAQTMRGTVMDKITGKPVASATIFSSHNLATTYSDGIFSLNGVYPGDTLTVSCLGYKVYKKGIDLSTPKTIVIYLQQTNIILQNVVIKAKHNARQDSIRLRKQFAEVFAYKAPTFYDMFVKVDPYVYVPSDYIFATKSTATLVSVNVLAVASLLSKSKDHITKLQQTLLSDEESTYVDRRFSKDKITSLTNLKGDSLLDFMADYRPAIKTTKKMTDYDLIKYIRSSYREFLITYDPAQRSPFR